MFFYELVISRSCEAVFVALKTNSSLHRGRDELRVILSTYLSIILIDSCWPQKEWFADFQVLLAEELF